MKSEEISRFNDIVDAIEDGTLMDDYGVFIRTVLSFITKEVVAPTTDPATLAMLVDCDLRFLDGTMTAEALESAVRNYGDATGY